MIKPESNAPSPMKPWVRTTDKQIEQLESAVARVESVLDASTENIDYALNQGLSNTFEFIPLEDGSTEAHAGAINFTGAITSESDISLAGSLVVGDPSRQEYNPTTGESIGSIPNLEVVSGQLEINPVTEVEYYTTGQINTTDATFNLNGYGSINGDGMQITLSNNGQVERQNIEILGASGTGTDETFQIENNTSNVAIYTAGKYVNITGTDPAGYNGENLLITSINTGVSPMTFTVAGTESGTYVAGGYVTINQPNSIYEGRISVQGPAPSYDGVTVDQLGVHVGTNGGDPVAADVRLDLTGLTAPSAFIDQAVINGTRLFISDTPPTAVNDGDIWIDKVGIFTQGGGTVSGPLTFGTLGLTATNGSSPWNGSSSATIDIDITKVPRLASENTFTAAINSGTGTYDGYNTNSTIRAEFRGTAGTHRPYIELQGVSANDGANENGGAFIRFRTSRSAGYGADIGAIRKPTGASQLIFKTGTAVVDAITQKMAIDENGNVLINGFASGTTGLTIRGASGQSVNLYEVQNNSSVLLGGMSSAGRLYVQRQEGIQFMDGTATLRSRIYSAGNNGIYFDTGVGTVRVLTLDGGSEAITGNLINPYSASRQGLIIRGLASQSGDLQQWQDSAGTVLAGLTPSGNLNISQQVRVGGSSSLGQLSVTSLNAGNIGAVIRGATSQTSDLLQFQASSGTYAGGFERGGALNIQPTTAVNGYSFMARAASASVVPVMVRGAASQSADLQQWQNSAGIANLKINSIGDINGTIVNGSYPITYNIMTGHNPEGKLTANPMLVNDIAYARLRGSTFTWTGLTPSSSDIDAMFNASSSFWNVAAGSFPNPQVIEFTSPVTLTYGAFFGISFGNSGWAVRDITLEAFSEGVWKTVATTTSNNSEVFMGAIPTNAGVGTTKFRITLATPLGAAVRITHIFAYNFASPLAKQIYLGRDGGTMFGDVQGAGKLIGFGFGRFGSDIAFTDSTALRVTPSATTNVGAIIRGQASQTADLQQWQNSAGTVLSRVQSDGSITGTSLTVTSGGTYTTGSIYADSNWGMIFRARTASPVNAQYRWANSVDGELMRLDNSGRLIVSNGLAGGVQGTAQIEARTVNATTIGMIVRGASAQTADLLQLQDSAASNLLWVNSAGFIRQFGDAGGQVSIVSNLATNRGIVVRGAASQSADLQQWQDSAGNNNISISPTFGLVGRNAGTLSFAISSGAGLAAFYATAPTNVPMLLRGAATQTADLLQLQNSAGTNQFRVDPAGMTIANSLGVAGSPSGISYAYFTTPSASAIPVVIRGATSQTANLFVLQNSAGTTQGAVDGSGNAVFGRLRLHNGNPTPDSSAIRLLVETFAAQVGAVVKGAASQTANLQEWQNSAGSVLAFVRNDGVIRAPFLSTSNNWFFVGEENSGSYLNLTRQTAATTNPSANQGKLYFRDGTTAGTLKFVARTGTAGVEETIVDNLSSTGSTAGARFTGAGGVVTTGTLTSTGLLLSSTTSPITLNGSVGTSGQVLTSAGVGATPTWTTVSGGGSFTGGTLTSDLILAAGSGTVEPLTFQTNSATPATTSGAMDYDGTVFYQTSNTNPGRALSTQDYYYVSSSNYIVDFSGSGAVQSMLDATTKGITVAAGTTYEFELSAAVQHQYQVNTGITGTYQLVATTVSGSPTVANISYVDYGSNTTSFTTATTMSSVRTTGNVTFMSTISSGSRYGIIRVKGIIRVTGTGTVKIYPGLSASGTNDNTWTVQSGLTFRMTPVGNGTVNAVGSWT
jgi:hypothetical protein